MHFCGKTSGFSISAAMQQHQQLQSSTIITKTNTVIFIWPTLISYCAFMALMGLNKCRNSTIKLLKNFNDPVDDWQCKMTTSWNRSRSQWISRRVVPFNHCWYGNVVQILYSFQVLVRNRAANRHCPALFLNFAKYINSLPSAETAILY